ncbi:M48 family metallopeptidase [Streptomyces misionensis]|uniref:M48 family metallopeptidase n=1 Tax=Streptomyces misionensis TaxID=67331 RepID=UPI00382AA7D0
MARQQRALERVLADGRRTAPWNAALVGALALATVVNLVTVALAGTGVWLLVVGTWPERVLGAAEIVIALVLRPRFGRMPRHTLDAAAAPVLHAVTKRIAAELGTKPMDAIAVDARYGSGCTVVGPRRRRVLVIGLPLWETLTADQRLALLGHDLGRASTRGGPSGAWIQTALDALATWADMISPTTELEAARQGVADANAFRPDSLRQNTNISLGHALAQPLQNLLAHGMLALHRLLGRLDDLSGRQSQYRADEMSVRVSSTASADGLLRALLLDETARFAVERAARSGGDVWARVRASLASVPDTERERLLRLARLRGDSTDGSSPPTYFRIQFVNRIPGPRTAVPPSGEEAQAIDEELRPLRTAIADELRSRAG